MRVKSADEGSKFSFYFRQLPRRAEELNSTLSDATFNTTSDENTEIGKTTDEIDDYKRRS